MGEGKWEDWEDYWDDTIVLESHFRSKKPLGLQKISFIIPVLRGVHWLVWPVTSTVSVQFKMICDAWPEHSVEMVQYPGEGKVQLIFRLLDLGGKKLISNPNFALTGGFVGGPCDLWPLRISSISDPLWRVTDELIGLVQAGIWSSNRYKQWPNHGWTIVTERSLNHQHYVDTHRCVDHG